MGVAHVAFDLRPRCESRDRVNDHNVDGTRANQHVDDLERLLTGVGLANQKVIHIHTNGACIDRVHRVFGVDVGADTAVALGFGHHVHCEGGLTRGLGTVHLNDASPRQTADSEGHVEGQGSRGDGLNGEVRSLAHAHDRAFAELLFDLAERGVKCLGAIVGCH